MRPTPGIVSSRSSAVLKRAQPLRDLGAHPRDAARPAPRCAPAARRAGSADAPPIRPTSARSSAAALLAQPCLAPAPPARPRPSSPATSAPSIARPDTPRMSVATDGQLDVGPFQRLLQPVDLGRALVHQTGAVAGQLAQLALGAVRHEAGPQQPVPQQVGDPLAVLHVGLAPGHRLDVLRVDQQQAERGPPAGCRPASSTRPVPSIATCVQPASASQSPSASSVRRSSCRRSGSPCVAPAPARRHQARHHRPLVHVQPATPLVHDVHAHLPLAERAGYPRGSSVLCVLPSWERQSAVLRDTQGRVGNGLASPDTGRSLNSPRLFPSVPDPAAGFIYPWCRFAAWTGEGEPRAADNRPGVGARPNLSPACFPEGERVDELRNFRLGMLIQTIVGEGSGVLLAR